MARSRRLGPLGSSWSAAARPRRSWRERERGSWCEACVLVTSGGSAVRRRRLEALIDTVSWRLLLMMMRIEAVAGWLQRLVEGG